LNITGPPPKFYGTRDILHGWASDGLGRSPAVQFTVDLVGRLGRVSLQVGSHDVVLSGLMSTWERKRFVPEANALARRNGIDGRWKRPQSGSALRGKDERSKPVP
jgi:hypothetical protein